MQTVAVVCSGMAYNVGYIVLYTEQTRILADPVFVLLGLGRRKRQSPLTRLATLPLVSLTSC